MDVTAALDRAACGETVDVSGEVARAMAAARGWTLKDGRKTDGPAAIASGPLDIDDAIWGELDAFAVRTYVPESAQSRDRGAGAGAIDND